MCECETCFYCGKPLLHRRSMWAHRICLVLFILCVSDYEMRIRKEERNQHCASREYTRLRLRIEKYSHRILCMAKQETMFFSSILRACVYFWLGRSFVFVVSNSKPKTTLHSHFTCASAFDELRLKIGLFVGRFAGLWINIPDRRTERKM